MLHNINSLIIKLQAHKEYGGVKFFAGAQPGTVLLKRNT